MSDFMAYYLLVFIEIDHVFRQSILAFNVIGKGRK